MRAGRPALGALFYFSRGRGVRRRTVDFWHVAPIECTICAFLNFVQLRAQFVRFASGRGGPSDRGLQK